jgi:hypothetical protein
MKLSDLSPAVRERLKAMRYDRIIEKHEGPWSWDGVLKYEDPDFLLLHDHWVLLPVSRAQHPQITLLRCIESADGQTLTLFLKDTTYDQGVVAGRVAVCDKFPDAEFFVAVLYHEWFIIGPPCGVTF